METVILDNLNTGRRDQIDNTDFYEGDAIDKLSVSNILCKGNTDTIIYLAGSQADFAIGSPIHLYRG